MSCKEAYLLDKNTLNFNQMINVVRRIFSIKSSKAGYAKNSKIQNYTHHRRGWVLGEPLD